jgi:hypothetical protein
LPPDGEPPHKRNIHHPSRLRYLHHHFYPSTFAPSHSPNLSLRRTRRFPHHLNNLALRTREETPFVALSAAAIWAAKFCVGFSGDDGTCESRGRRGGYADGNDSELEEAQFECSGWKCGAVKGQAEEGEGGLVNRRTGIWSITPSSFFPPRTYILLRR